MSSLESDLKKEKKREIPSHVGILGNEKAVAAAKSALSLPVTRMKLPGTGMYPLLSGDDLLECGTCQCPLTVKHILVECVDLKDIRNKHFVASYIKDLFDNVEAHKIIDFIKETRFISNFNVFILRFVICFFFILA